MITFRYHIVSLVSVFLALAIGIALGGGPLKGEVDNSLVKELAARKKVQKEQRQEIRRLPDNPVLSQHTVNLSQKLCGERHGGLIMR